MREELTRILGGGHENLIEELEALIPFTRILVESEPEFRDIAVGEPREKLKSTREAVRALRECLGNDGKAGDGIYRLMVELMRSGHTRIPRKRILDRVRKSTPFPVTEEGPKFLLFCAVMESQERERRGERPTEFLDSLNGDLGVLEETLSRMLEGTARGGRPKDIVRPMIANSAAGILDDYGIRPTTARGGTYEQVLAVCLNGAGAYTPNNPEDLGPLLQEGVRHAKERARRNPDVN